MSDCRDEERRKDYPDMREMIGRIDERTKAMAENMEKLATIERVQSLEGRVNRHIRSHVSRGGMFVSWAGIAVAIGVGILGVFKK